MDLGAVLIGSYVVLASSTNVPSSASDPLEIEDALTGNVKSIEVVNTTAGIVELYLGANTSLNKIMTIGGAADLAIMHQRQPVCMQRGLRLSVRNSAAAALATGAIVINLWG